MNAAWLNALRQRGSACWRQRSPREQQALRRLAAVLAVAIAAQLLWSLDAARREQARRLPALAAEAARVTALGAAWREIGEAPPPPRADVVERALAPRLGELGADVVGRWQGDGSLSLSGYVEPARWLRWSAAMQQEYRLHLARCQLNGEGGRIRIEAVYRSGTGAR